MTTPRDPATRAALLNRVVQARKRENPEEATAVSEAYETFLKAAGRSHASELGEEQLKELLRLIEPAQPTLVS